MTNPYTSADLDLELAYTPAATACRDVYSASVWCRRAPGHNGDHAAGHGEHRVRWT